MAKRNLPSLKSLQAFEAAARHLSFRVAAEELSLTQSAISHQVAGLEERLGTSLFRRAARRVELTEAGAQLYPYLRDGFDRLAQGVGLVDRVRISGDLVVQVYVTVAVRWLLPRLHQFQAAHPDILVRLSTSQLDWEFDPTTGDLGLICTRTPNGPGIHYTHLFDAKLVAVCSPAVQRAGLGLRQPADLVNHAMLQVYTAAEDWHDWLEAARLPTLKGRAAPKFDSYLLAIEAAIEGQGVAVVPEFMVAPDLKSGRLVKPFPEIEVRHGASWYLACLEERVKEPRMQHFRDWLVAEIAQDAAFAG
ncbi:LysR substrate-binding domain-containing protein [Dongia sp.]|uniref:LysR substrate-binding domain-containing protein n=1 Tax=Dongia sp. TaxID=1977262 RepID=UPI0035B0569D